MPDNATISWAPDARPSPTRDDTEQWAEANGDNGWGTGGEGDETDPNHGTVTATNTQRNTPIALAAHEPAEPVEDDEFNVNEELQHVFAVSPGLAPLTSHRPRSSSNQTSYSSLNSLSGHGGDRSPRLNSPAANRAQMPRTSQSLSRGRRSSHGKSFSTSSVHTPKGVNNERLTYPAQSIEELQGHLHAPRPTRPLRTKSSLPSQNLLYNEMSLWTQPDSRPKLGQHPGF